VEAAAVLLVLLWVMVEMVAMCDHPTAVGAVELVETTRMDFAEMDRME